MLNNKGFSIVILVLGIFAILALAAMGSFYYKIKFLDLPPQVEPSASLVVSPKPEATSFPISGGPLIKYAQQVLNQIFNNCEYWEKKKIQAIKWEDSELVAYRITGGDADAPTLSNIYFVVRKNNLPGKIPYPSSLENIIAVSTMPYYTTPDNVMALVGSSLYLINSVNRSIEEYKLVYNAQADEDSSKKYYSELIGNYSLPRYQLGSLYRLVCESGSTCKVRTALHLEGGCDMEFNTNTKKFSTPTCGQGASKYVSIDLEPLPD